MSANGLSISIRKHRHKRATLLPVPGLAERERAAGVPESLRTKDLLSGEPLTTTSRRSYLRL